MKNKKKNNTIVFKKNNFFEKHEYKNFNFNFVFLIVKNNIFIKQEIWSEKEKIEFFLFVVFS